MKLGKTNYGITCTREKDWKHCFNSDNKWEIAAPECVSTLKEIMTVYKSKTLTDDEKFEKLLDLKKRVYPVNQETSDESTLNPKDVILEIMSFFNEFKFTPNFRFINTLAFLEVNRAKEFVLNYFKLIDSVYTENVEFKVEQPQFSTMIEKLYALDRPSKRINKRFKLYYGSQGTGKTTKAAKECDDVMVCHSAILPQDIMEDFDFVDGKAIFKPSKFQMAMREGKKICMDEINLLPYDSLRFLQSVLDGKESFVYKGEEIKIADGFQVIGTMNLVVNGVVFSLPEPLIDRAADLVEFKLTADDLVNALWSEDKEEYIEEPVQVEEPKTTMATNSTDKKISLAEEMFGKKLKDLDPDEKRAYNRVLAKRHYDRHKATA